MIAYCNTIASLMHWRIVWVQVCRAALEQAGHDGRMEHRSYAARGIDLQVPPKRLKRNDAQGQTYVDE